MAAVHTDLVDRIMPFVADSALDAITTAAATNDTAHTTDEINSNGVPEQPLFPEELETYSFDLKGLREWLIAFFVCDFNVDVGVEVEYMFPSTELSSADIEQICISSFPEKSNSDNLSSSSFHFKFRHSSSNIPHTPSPHDPSHWYGYCLFRQKYDPTAKRSYRQKSLILVSQHEFPPLFQHVVKTIGMLAFDVSPAVVESACSNIAAWGKPQIGVRELPFLGEILEVHTPPHYAFPLQGLMPKSSENAELKVQCTEIHTSGPVGSWARLAALLSSLSELYVIFERALLSEPLVVLALDPTDASEFVSAVVDLIRPIPFAGDSRPFFPMQSDIPSELRDPLPLRHYLIGITNPFFLKRLLDQNPPSSDSSSGTYVVYLAGPDTRPKSLLSYHTYISSRSSTTIEPVKPVEWDFPEQMTPTMEAKTYIAKDHGFVQKLEEKLRDPDVSPQAFSVLLRRHFALLTAYFLAPLNRYLATLATPCTSPRPPSSSHSINHPSITPPSLITSSPAFIPPPSPSPLHEHTQKTKHSIDIANFSEEEFIQSLWKYGCSVPFKGKTNYARMKNTETFYRKFCRSPSFYTWLEMKMMLNPEGKVENGGG
ncbi:hypothetical protein EX30DRAFT_340852 [Ascodesmis nigricans]|uniref:UDENN domain-containing protein n=1 Tax=Ascodesmis nigricans TaxID=341454 RepID=A0A4S2MX25_9PEZI|nr:hypothetical protein EX30DRAFT_340852 [Ascodesmis nigricans]